MIKVICLPNYLFFGDLHTESIIPSTFLLAKQSNSLTKLEENRSNVS